MRPIMSRVRNVGNGSPTPAARLDRPHPAAHVPAVTPSGPLLRRLALSAALLLSSATAASAQARRDGRIAGAVVDKATGNPVAGATVVSLIDGKSQRTDSAGTYRLEKLPSGIIRVLVRADGFPAKGVIVALGPGEVVDQRIELDSTAAAAAPPPPQNTGATTGRFQALPTVTVEATPSLGPRYASFERRRKTGVGQFVVRADIEKGGFNNLQDVLRTLRGVTMDCANSHTCGVRMARAPMRCLPEYIVDDTSDPNFGPTVAVRDIEAIEVYTGPADVPGEYAGRNAGCGVIVIWTRSGPSRRPRK